MSDLIEELKKDHVEIVEMLSKVKELGIGTNEGKEMLLSAKGGLLAHLKKEDRKLYPALKTAAERNDSLKHTLEIFAKDMDSVSKTALEFFEKYAHGGSGVEFAKDFGRLAAVLKIRIEKEEKILYPEYKKLNL